MSKLSFRARALDPSKPMPIYLAEELPDLPEYSAINRAVPQMPSGMEKEEESEHHLQRAICTGLIIPTPEVFEATDSEFYERYYPQDYKMPKQMIHMQPLNLEQDVPDYDMDSGDEQWVNTQGKRLDLDALRFETMMDRLERSSGQTVVTLHEAKALLKQDDEVSIAVYDYWLNKRLKTQHPLILSVKTESRGNTTPNNPYLAFRRRTEKMQTRKNRKNDESSYEKMLKLRRDLSRAVTLLEMIKRREKMKREQLHLSIEIYEKRYQTQDFNGQLLAEFTSTATKATRPAFAPIYSNQYSSHHSALAGSGSGVTGNSATGAVYGSGASSHYHVSTSSNKRDAEALTSGRKEKRQYKKRKHKIPKERSSANSTAVAGSSGMGMGHAGAGTAGYHYQYHPAGTGIGGAAMQKSAESTIGGGLGTDSADPTLSSDDEELANLQGSTTPEEEYTYAFRRSKFSQYHRPITNGFGNWPWESKEENGTADPRYRFTLTSLRHPRPRCIGFARRRMGRGGRVIIDRATTDLDDLWSRLDYKIIESETTPAAAVAAEPEEESIVIPVATAVATPAAAVASSALGHPVNRKRKEESGLLVYSDGIKRRKQLVIKEETDLDELFMAGVGLVRRHDSEERLASGDAIQVKQEKLSDERTSATAASSSAFVISSNSSSSCSTSGNVNNSENNVIKREAGDESVVEVKQEVLEDYEHMIDNVNNSYRNRISNNSNSSRPVNGGSSNSSSSNSSTNVNSRNNFIQTFSNSISSSIEQSPALSQYQTTRSTTSPGITTSWLRQSSSSRLNEQLDSDDPSPESGRAIASVYADLLDEIQSSWLHFRPKTPEPVPLEEDADLLHDDPLFQTDANRIALELQAIGAELPADVFNSDPTEQSVYRTKPFALDNLVEPHPMGLDGGSSNAATTGRKDGDDLGVKLETCSNSDNNLSGDSLNDLNLSLNESNEDEKMLDKILQECQIDDMKSLNQTSNFWNGILEDGILNQLEGADEAGAGTGTDIKEDPLTVSELINVPTAEDVAVNKIGYCSELVGFDRPSTIERFKSKRRKILKRCNYQVGSSFFLVRNPPKEEIFRPQPNVEESDPGAEKTADVTVAATETELKAEQQNESVSTTIPAEQIKIEPPDELLSTSSPFPSQITTPNHQSNTVMLPAGTGYHQQSLSIPQIKLEPVNHLQATTPAHPTSASSAATSFLITSPAVQVVQQQPQTVINPLVATGQTTVPVIPQQQQQQQQQQSTAQITIATGTGTAGSANSSGTSTPTGSYIVQHTTPIVLSQQQMQQLANSGGNIVTVSGNQVMTTKQQLGQQLVQHQQQQQQQQIQLQHGITHQGETYVLTATPAGASTLKKQLNGPNDKTVKQNVINPKFHTLINQKLAAGQKAGDLNKKQLEMITKAIVSSQKMIVKSATPVNHSAAAQMVQQQLQQQQQQQQGNVVGTSTYNVVHQNSLQQPITILSTTSQNPQQPTQNKIILTSSPQFIQQKIALNSNLVAAGQQAAQQAQFQTDGTVQGQAGTGGGTVVGQAGQHVKLEKTVNMLFDADKNRIVYTNIKNSRGQFLAQINQKVVNIIQPFQQQKLVNSVGTLQQQQQQTQQHTTTVQSLLGGSSTTTIVNSKGFQRIPAVSIRAQQIQQQQQQHQHQQQLDGHGTTTVALATNNATNSIKFIQVSSASAAVAAAAAAAAASGGNNDNNTAAAASAVGASISSVGSNTVATATTMVVSASSSSSSSSSSSLSAAGGSSGNSTATATPPTSINITNR